ncbi:MAG: hypothetical protein A2Y93_03225 [Chloroflexi bacterium RBG_13_68_17]|nr:MAG: hypothetical protein A2Y93_03225 [Chloroflexi bacterium RBG_13_68_17]
MPEILAVDLGGTNIRVARFPSAQPPATTHSKTPTRAAEGPEAVIARILQAIESIAPPSRADMRIGIGAPGPLDTRRGVILDAPNLPGWLNLPLRERVADHFGCPVALGNDANLAALAEWRFGAGRGCTELLYLTISTGIGGGVISDGHLLLGAQGLAAELGHMTLLMGGPTCSCGQHGHLEGIASGPAIARRAAERLAAGEASSLRALSTAAEGLTAEAVGQAARQGDTLARLVVDEAAEAIGCHLASLLHAFNPQVVVLGGGVMQIGDLLLPGIEAAMRAQVMHPAFLDGLRIARAQLGEDVGLIGAMALASEL